MVHLHLSCKKKCLNCTLSSIWFWYFSTLALWYLCLPSRDILFGAYSWWDFFLLGFCLFVFVDCCLFAFVGSFVGFCLFLGWGFLVVWFGLLLLLLFLVFVFVTEAAYSRWIAHVSVCSAVCTHGTGSCYHWSRWCSEPLRAAVAPATLRVQQNHLSVFLIARMGSPLCCALARPPWNGFFSALGKKKVGAVPKAGQQCPLPGSPRCSHPLAGGGGQGVPPRSRGASLCSVWPPSVPSSGCGHLPTFHRPGFPRMEFLQTFLFSHSHIKQSPVKTPAALVPVNDFSPLEFPQGHMELPFNVMCTCHHCLSGRQILNKTRFNWTKKQVQKMPNKTQSSCFAVNTVELSCYVGES